MKGFAKFLCFNLFIFQFIDPQMFKIISMLVKNYKFESPNPILSFSVPLLIDFRFHFQLYICSHMHLSQFAYFHFQ